MEQSNEELKNLKDQLKQQEKLASLGLLSAGIAHEVQNPLNFVINFAKMSGSLLKDLSEIIEDNADKLPDGESDEVKDIITDLNANLGKIAEHGERAIDIIRSILLVSRGKENEYIPSDVVKIIKEYVWLAYHAMRANNKGFNVSIHEDYQQGLPNMMVIPQDLSRAILNIMNNACYAVWHKQQNTKNDYNPEISIKVSGDNKVLSIIVRDNGEGMTDEAKQKLYDNFFTTKPIGKGTGLGMGITRDIIENKHNGKITFDTKEGDYTCFELKIPIRLK